MKSKNLNGHIMSEKEMKEVKGGYANENSYKENLVVCVACGERLEGTPHSYNGGYRIFCYNCGTYVDVDKTQE